MDMFMENAHMNCHGHEFSCMIMVMPRVFAAMLHVYIYSHTTWSRAIE